jgi:hypothetical protein
MVSAPCVLFYYMSCHGKLTYRIVKSTQYIFVRLYTMLMTSDLYCRGHFLNFGLWTKAEQYRYRRQEYTNTQYRLEGIPNVLLTKYN